ncbi:MAG: V-type ATPase subunit [Oscillospiraceae bacterium]|nr:V-type ATPase subunit [Oscillospiraceae bacterium]
MISKRHNISGKNLNATVARLHALYGKMLKSRDYSALISCSSVADAAGYLKHSTHYSKVLQGIDTDTIHRGSLENILRRSVYERYFSIIGFEKIGDAEFYNFKTVKTEIDELLICITHLNAGTTDHITTLPIYMNKFTSFDLMELAKVRSFEELLKLTEHTDYYEILADLRPEKVDGAEGHINYAACELRLRTYYSKRLMESAEMFDKVTAKELKNIIGTQIDMINIINAYRMTAFFHADKEETKERMIPLYLRIPESKLDELYSARDEKEFLERFAKTYYGRTAAEMGFDMTNPETALSLMRHKQIKRAFRRSVSAPECFYTFVNLAETEVKNVIRIIEGIRYAVPVKEISQLIIETE